MNITNIDDIRKLASGDEGGRTEYKLITGQLERGMETLCAFLNGEGGTVLFGVADNGTRRNGKLRKPSAYSSRLPR